MLYKLSPTADKNFHVIEGASHYDLYWKPEFLDEAVDYLVAFYSKQVGS